MRVDYDIWTVDPEDPKRRDVVTCRKCVDIESGKSIEFVIAGGRTENEGDDSGTWLVARFDSFTIDGREPTEAEEEEFKDDLRGIVWDIFTES